ncbi:MAG TPA: hypothetical protein VHM88_22205 [Candidatus Acidoferrales bacterium]|nr:hypothetical protein [Candidatus Acidoferrales bacterium]
MSSAGGVGLVGGSYAGTLGGEADLEAELARAKSGKFGVGFIMWALERAPKMRRGAPWPREYSFRFLKNKLTDEWVDREGEAFRAFGTAAEKYAQARANNDLDTVAVVRGEALGLPKDRPPAKVLVRSMVLRATDLLRNGGKLKFT